MITGDAKETAIAISQQLTMSQKRAVSGKTKTNCQNVLLEHYFCLSFQFFLTPTVNSKLSFYTECNSYD